MELPISTTSCQQAGTTRRGVTPLVVQNEPQAPKNPFEDFFVALSPRMKDIRAKAIVAANSQRINKSQPSVLITGPTGCGKGLLAEFIHNNGPRADKPFISVICPSIPKELVASILFGHKKGAFTGAYQHSEGKFSAADSGTIFLDEIGDMPLEVQAQLLGVLDHGVIDRVGEPGTDRSPRTRCSR